MLWNHARGGSIWFRDLVYLLRECCAGMLKKLGESTNAFALSIVHPLSGQVRMGVVGQECPVHEGEYVVANPQTVLKYPPPQEWPLHYRTVTIRQAGLRAQLQGPSRPGMMDPRVQRAAEFLGLHYAEPVNVAALAREVGLGRSWFYDHFKACYGQSPNDYLQALRVKKATELLRQGRTTIEEVSRAVGYTSVSAFYKVFQAHTKAPPRVFRSPKSPL